ncbi:MAG: hypothetical protein H7061_13475 [Bdellovibrionaceae bacterium]|nr:hypothetical protein [Bdellovibrio sp.]
MCFDSSCLGYLLIIVIAAYAILIFFGLKYRKKVLEKNLLLTADQIWRKALSRTNLAKLKKSNLLFSIQQDGSLSTTVLVIKDHNDAVIGQVECATGHREYKIWVGKDLYRINFLLSGWRSAQLISDINANELASYKMVNIYGQHEFNIPGYGKLVSKRVSPFWPKIFNYHDEKTILGLKQRISATRVIGNLVVLPSDIPLAIRIFILVL